MPAAKCWSNDFVTHNKLIHKLKNSKFDIDKCDMTDREWYWTPLMMLEIYQYQTHFQQLSYLHNAQDMTIGKNVLLGFDMSNCSARCLHTGTGFKKKVLWELYKKKSFFFLLWSENVVQLIWNFSSIPRLNIKSHRCTCGFGYYLAAFSTLNAEICFAFF